jgi:hypothetical protein
MHCQADFVASPLTTPVNKPVDEFDRRIMGLIRAADAQLASYASSTCSNIDS